MDRTEYPQSHQIMEVVARIVELVSPQRVYLYNQRMGVHGDTTAFKLCIIAGTPDKDSAERDIYLQVDSDVPFDVILYTPEEWCRLCETTNSFARKISLTGRVVYG